MAYARGSFTGLGLIFAIGAFVMQEWLIGGALLLLTLFTYLLLKGSVRGFFMLLLVVFAVIGFFTIFATADTEGRSNKVIKYVETETTSTTLTQAPKSTATRKPTNTAVLWTTKIPTSTWGAEATELHKSSQKTAGAILKNLGKTQQPP